MDNSGRIYLDEEDKAPPEDKARLDGYLRGRAAADEEARFEAKVAELEAKIAKLERG